MERCIFCQGELDLTTRRCRQCQRLQPGIFPPATTSDRSEEPGDFHSFPEQESAFSESPSLIPEETRSARRHLSRRTLVLGLAGLVGMGLTGGILGRLIYVLDHQQAHYIYHGHVGEGEIDALAWSPDSQRIASGAFSLQIWDALSGSHVHIFPDRKGVDAAAWSSDGKYLASGFWDFTAAIWEVATEKRLLTYRGHLQQSVRASLSQPRLVGVHPKMSLYPATVDVPGVDELAWSRDSTRLFSSGGDGTAQVWEALTGKQLLKFGSQLDFYAGAAWSPDNTHLMMWTRRGIEIHDAISGGLLATYPIANDRVSGPLAYSPDGKYLATIDDQEIHLWDLATGRQILTYRGHSNIVSIVAWSPDSKRLASAGFDLTVQIWDAANGHTEYIYQGHMGLWQKFFSVQAPEGPSLASQTTLAASYLPEEPLTKQIGLSPQDTVPRSHISALAWAPNGRYIASGGSDATVQVWQPR
jgi:WD40 repeat protein